MVTPAELNRRAELYNQLATMLAAGLPLTRALEMVQTNAAVRGSRKVISGLVDNLQAGYTFTDSMRRVQGWMSEFDVALLSAGEESGRLDVSFKLLSNYYATRAKIIRDTISGLIVTVATLHVFLIVFPIGLLPPFVWGIINGRYADCVPFIVEKIIVFGALYGFVLLLIFAGESKRGHGWRSAKESLFDLIPFLRTAQKNLALSRLAAALDALTNAGVNTIKSWELAAAASGSVHLAAAVSHWKPQIEGGMTPADLVNQTRYFPELFVNLYQTGEISGRLDDTLQRLRVYYEEEGFRALRTFTRIMNGTIYALVVAVVAMNIIRFWMNYYGAALGGM